MIFVGVGIQRLLDYFGNLPWVAFIKSNLRSRNAIRNRLYLCLRKYFVFCRNLISFCLVSQGDDFASIPHKKDFQIPSVKINCMFQLVDYELGFAGWFVVTFSSCESLLVSVQGEFLVQAGLNIAFYCFHSPARWSLGEPLCELTHPGESAHVVPLADAMQTRLCLESFLRVARCPFVKLPHLHGSWKMAKIGC